MNTATSITISGRYITGQIRDGSTVETVITISCDRATLERHTKDVADGHINTMLSTLLADDGTTVESVDLDPDGFLGGTA